MPNTRVKFSSGIMGGVIAGTTYQIIQKIYITFQIGVSKYGAIYGSFAALPLFLLWVHISWLILLFGAEISFSYQNVHTFEYEPDCEKASVSFKILVVLKIAHEIVKNFCLGEKSLTAAEISLILDAPIRLINLLLSELVDAGILSEIKEVSEKDVSYQPARKVQDLNVFFVVNAFLNKGFHDIPIADSAAIKALSNSITEFGSLIKTSKDNILLMDIK